MEKPENCAVVMVASGTTATRLLYGARTKAGKEGKERVGGRREVEAGRAICGSE